MEGFNLDEEKKLCEDFTKERGMYGGSGTIAAYVWVGWHERAKRSYPEAITGIEEDHF